MAKIGIIISSLYACGGEERVVSLMANEWVKHHEVTIFTYENREAEGNNRNDYFLSDKIRVQRVTEGEGNIFRTFIKLLYYHTGLTKGKLSQFFWKKAFFPERMLEEWIKRINEGGYDLVIGISGIYTMLLGQIKGRIGARALGWEHSSYEGYFAKGKGYCRNLERLFAECASKLDGCVVLNEDIRQKYKKNLNLDATVIYNPRSFASSQKADMGQKCFVTCGRAEAEKGYDDLVFAFHRLGRENEDWKLLIIGGGSLKGELEKKIDELGIGHRASITGYVHNVEELLRQGSVFVLTSRWEGFPMSVTEALELGLPVVSYDIPAMVPLVKDGVEGKIVPAFDREALAGAMAELAQDEGMRKKMSGAAVEKASSLSAERIAQRWYKLFGSLNIV